MKNCHCGKPGIRAGLCSAHYQQERRARLRGPGYDGPIRCGDTFHGLLGFVWSRTGDSVTFYLKVTDPAMDDPPKLVTVPESVVREHLISEPNEGGTVIFEAVA